MIIHILSGAELEAIRNGDVVSVMISGLCVGLTSKKFLNGADIEEAENGTSRTEKSEEN